MWLDVKSILDTEYVYIHIVCWHHEWMSTVGDFHFLFSLLHTYSLVSVFFNVNYTLRNEQQPLTSENNHFSFLLLVFLFTNFTIWHFQSKKIIREKWKKINLKDSNWKTENGAISINKIHCNVNELSNLKMCNLIGTFNRKSYLTDDERVSQTQNK